MRNSTFLFFGLSLAILGAAGCGDSNKKPSGSDGGLDASNDGMVAEDGQVGNDGDVPDGAGGDVEITGTVYEGGDPVVGVQVRSYDEEGTFRDSTTTDSNGQFTLAGMSGLVDFVRVNPTTDSMGMVRGFEIADGVKQLNIDGGITLEDRSDFADRVDELMGTPEPTYDNTKGHVVVGFTFQEGVTDGNGMNATVEVGADDTWSTFIIHDDPAVVLQLNGAPIPEVCPSVDVACREEGNEDVPLFVPNVTVGTAKVTPVNGGGFTCSPRVTPGIGFPVSYWPVFADTRTLIVMDCGE